ncbi:MAG: ABC transporter permease [Peptococcaceae bacterium]|nr:ABC transporter permease [Peptococcaceae bacterium]
MKSFLASLKVFLIGAVPILLFLIFWEAGARAIPRGVIAPASEALKALGQSAWSGELWVQTLISLERVVKGFCLSFIIGIPLGFLLGSFFTKVERALLPFLRTCEKLNPFAIIPIFMIFFGIGTTEKVVVVFWATLWPILFNTMVGARNIEPNMLRAAQSMGASRWEMLTKVIVPNATPNIFIGIEFAAQVAFFMIIASEVIGASTGLGWYYSHAYAQYQLPLVYGTVLYITILAIVVNVFFKGLKKRLLVWKEESNIG